MEINLITATAEDFEAYVGETFTIQTDQGMAALTLDNIKRHDPSTKRDNVLTIEGVVYPPRDPFSLTFAGPLEPVLPQMIYSLDHDKIGRVEIFLSAFLKESSAILYEAVFN